MLLLFDLDGTLVSTGGAGRLALEAAIEDVTGVSGGLAGVRLSGNTDPRILQESFQLNVKRPCTDEDFHAVVAAYLTRLEESVAASTSYLVYPGVEALIPELARSEAHLLGLATGNVQRGAQIKLARAGLDHHFVFGGYGSDAADRGEMVAHGVRIGRELAVTHGVAMQDEDDVWVLGDTERDVIAAREAGVRVIGVCVGSGDREALEAAKPDVLVETLADPEIRELFRLPRA